MTFTLTATPQPFATPPRVLLEAEESDPDNPIQSCTFFRDGVPLRFSGAVSSGLAVVYDYDAPFDVALEYRADAVEADTLDLDFTESWTDLSAWTSEVAGWSAAAGVATSATSGATIRRDSAGDVARVSGPDPSFVGSTGALTVAGWNAASLLWSLTFDNTGSGTISLLTDSGVDSVAIALTDWTVDISSGSVTASGTGWSLTLPLASSLTTTRLKLSSTFSGGTSTSIDDISVYVFADPPTVDVSDTDTVTLTGVDSIWLSNTAAPELAVQITPDGSSPDGLVISPETRKETQSAAGSVLLDIEGSAYPMAVTNSPRKAETWTLVLHTLNADARTALKTLLANSAPVLLRAPSTFDYMRLDDGFYSVGDVSDGRVQEPWDNRDEIVTVPLPMQPLGRAPAFDVLWAWNLRTLAQTGMTLRDVANTFPSLRALLIGPS